MKGPRKPSAAASLRAAELALVEAENRLQALRKKGRRQRDRDEVQRAVKRVVEARRAFQLAQESWASARIGARRDLGKLENRPVVRCQSCGDAAESSVTLGPRGPFVVVACPRCARVWAPYEGPSRDWVLDYWLMERRSGGEWVSSSWGRKRR